MFASLAAQLRKAATWMGRALRRAIPWTRSRRGQATWADAARLRRLTAVSPGTRGVVRDLAGGDPAERARLVALGVTPGAPVTVLQTFPTLVIRCDEAELALEPRVARQVLVELTVDTPPPERAAAAEAGSADSPCRPPVLG